MAKITKRTVDAATPRGQRYYVWDDDVRGFGLLVLPSGVKSYFFQYRNQEGKTRRATIAKHGALAPDQARQRAREIAHEVFQGGDPLAAKRADRNALTVAELLERYQDSGRFNERAESTKPIDASRIKRHLIPTLGKKKAGGLTGEDVRHAFAAIRDGKTAVDEKTKSRGRAIVTGGEGAARMSIRVLRAAYNWAISEGLCASNPAARVNIGSDGTRETILEDAEAYARLFRTLARMETERRIRSSVADAIRVIALTGARRGEIITLRWRHVDLKKGVLVLPSTAHKTGRRTGKARIIGLPAAAQAILAACPKGSPDDLVFPPAKGNGPLNLSKPWRAIRAEAGLPEGIGLHGLRHSLASHMAMQGAQAAEIMTALGHRQLATAQRYVHWHQDARAALAEKAAAHITAALDEKPEADITPITRTK